MVKTVKDYRVGINKIFSRYTRYGFVEYRDCNGLECDMVKKSRIFEVRS